MVSSRTTAILALALCIGPSDVAAEERRFNTSQRSTKGEKMRGPATVVLTHVNVLRYEVKVGVDVQYQPPPDLSLPFLPTIPQLDAGAAPATVEKPGEEKGLSLVPTVNSILAALMTLENDRVARVEKPIAQLIDDTNHHSERVRAFVSASDHVLGTVGAAALAARAQTLATELEGVLKTRWPVVAIGDQLARLAGLRTQLAGIPISGLTADQKRTYDYIAGRLTQLEQWYASVGGESEAARKVRSAQGKLAEWRLILQTATEEAFTLDDVEVGCGFTFTGTKESKVELVRGDRLAARDAAPAREEIVTVVCSSPLSVSGGFGFSTVDRRTPAFVSTPQTTTVEGVETTTVVTRFGHADRSGYTGLPLLLVNVRLQEWTETLSGHLSFGAGVDAAGTAGTDVEYLAGASLGLFRGVFVTAGWHFAFRRELAGEPFGDEDELAPRFKPGDLVPTGLAEPPVEKRRDGGPMLAITVKIR